MDALDEITSKPSTTQEDGLSEIEKTTEITNNQNGDPSSSIENNPTASVQSDDVTSSQVPTISNEDPSKNTSEIANKENDDYSWFMEDNPTTSSQIPTISDGDPFENLNEITNNQNDDFSSFIENNPTTSSQVPTISNEIENKENDDYSWFIEDNPPTISNGDPFENLNEITNHQNDNSSSLIENNPTTSFQSNDVTKSQVPTISNGHSFEDNEQLFQLPPTAEEILADNSSSYQSGLSTIPTSENKSSYDMFSNEQSSPLQALMKKREEEIAAKDVEEKKKIEILRQQAKSDLENWYNDRQKQMEQKRRTMKNEENDLNTKALEKSSKEACDWSKVIRLLDFTDGTQLTKSKRDLTRMKACMFSAKRINDKKNINK